MIYIDVRSDCFIACFKYEMYTSKITIISYSLLFKTFLLTFLKHFFEEFKS